jgi:hypothetical protein
VTNCHVEGVLFALVDPCSKITPRIQYFLKSLIRKHLDLLAELLLQSMHYCSDPYSLPRFKSYRSYTVGRAIVLAACFCKRVRWAVNASRHCCSSRHFWKGEGLSVIACCSVFSTSCASARPGSTGCEAGAIKGSALTQTSSSCSLE